MGTEYNQSAGQSPEQTERAPGAGRTSATPVDLETRLASGPPLLLDGALGTELERLGIECSLPLWSSIALLKAPESVSKIHRAYAEAGCEILTANTFRTQRRTLAKAGMESRCAELTRNAVDLATNAASQASQRIFVAGSAPPLEDCYRPERVAENDVLETEHTEHAQNLARAGVDLILVETQNTIREAQAAAKAARETRLPFLVSFVCGDDARLLSGETLENALVAVAPYRPAGIGVNCLPPSLVRQCLPVLKHTRLSAHAELPFGVYANLGSPGESGYAEACSPQTFAQQALEAKEQGARFLGGCCGTTPAHMYAVASALRSNSGVPGLTP